MAERLVTETIIARDFTAVGEDGSLINGKPFPNLSEEKYNSLRELSQLTSGPVCTVEGGVRICFCHNTEQEAQISSLPDLNGDINNENNGLDTSGRPVDIFSNGGQEIVSNSDTVLPPIVISLDVQKRPQDIDDRVAAKNERRKRNLEAYDGINQRAPFPDYRNNGKRKKERKNRR